MTETIRLDDPRRRRCRRFASAPSGPAKGGVVVVQEAFGLTDHIASICDRLADAGLAGRRPGALPPPGRPDLHARRVRRRCAPLMGELTADGIRADVDAAIELPRRPGPRRPSGSRSSGSAWAGRSRSTPRLPHALGAAVTFYGGGVVEGRFGFPALVELAPALQTPWLGLYGDLDKGIPPEQVEALREPRRRGRWPPRWSATPDADHGFNNDDRPDVFDADGG